MRAKLYYGSSSIIQQPIFGFGKNYNDYSLGFYCTDSLQMAKEWGVSDSMLEMQKCQKRKRYTIPSR